MLNRAPTRVMKRKKAIVLEQTWLFNKLETTIKSVCTHNKNVKFYFNDDLPERMVSSYE